MQDYTDKKYGVCLEWHYTDGRAEQIRKYLKDVLKKTDSVELWHVWLMGYCEYEDMPVVHKHTIPIEELTIRDIYELDNADIWNSPDKNIPGRPSFYRLIITR